MPVHQHVYARHAFCQLRRGQRAGEGLRQPQVDKPHHQVHPFAPQVLHCPAGCLLLGGESHLPAENAPPGSPRGDYPEKPHADAVHLPDQHRLPQGLPLVSHVGYHEGEVRQAHLHEEGIRGLVELVVAESRRIVTHVIIRQQIGTGFEEVGDRLPRIEVPCIEQEHLTGE